MKGSLKHPHPALCLVIHLHLSRLQNKALQAFVRGKDVLVCLPTGTGKSSCYASLPYVFDMLRNKISEEQHSSIAVVVPPLSSLMQDQVKIYNAKELKAAFVRQDQKNDAIKADIVNGHYSLVYISPESMLTVLKYREMFRSSVYQQNLICLAIDEIHCIVSSYNVYAVVLMVSIGSFLCILPQGSEVQARVL